MLLRKLEDESVPFNVIIIQTNSDKLKTFIKDRVKRKFGCRLDSCIDCQGKKNYKEVRNIINIVPPFADKWFIDVKLDDCTDKEFLELVKESTSCVFVCTVTKYRNYKTFKTSLKDMEGVYDYYINYLKRNDFLYLYDAFVTKDQRIKKVLFDYVVQSYSGDIEAVFNLFIALSSNEKVETRTDVANVCGLGSNSTESFVISLLKPPATTAKGLKKVLRNRLRAGYELSNSYGCPAFYTRLKTVIYNFIQLKLLMINGVVYKQLNNIPNGFDAQSLNKYRWYIGRLKEIPLSRLLRLYNCLGKTRWKNDFEYQTFLYKYITVEEYRVAKEVVK